MVNSKIKTVLNELEAIVTQLRQMALEDEGISKELAETKETEGKISEAMQYEDFHRIVAEACERGLADTIGAYLNSMGFQKLKEVPSDRWAEFIQKIETMEIQKGDNNE